jgi:hypothetical protein
MRDGQSESSAIPELTVGILTRDFRIATKKFGSNIFLTRYDGVWRRSLLEQNSEPPWRARCFATAKTRTLVAADVRETEKQNWRNWRKGLACISS